MKDSKIEWTTHTFNPWIGCTKVSPGCANCYAEEMDRRRFSKTLGTGSHWGPGAPRHRTSAANWKQPLKWDREAAAAKVAHDGEDFNHAPYRRPRVFCASLADWLDGEVPIEWLADLLALVWQTPNLDWLLLTKRPQNWRQRMEAVHALRPAPSQDAWLLVNEWLGGRPPANVWIGTTVEDQERADVRIPAILKIPARVRFLSCEPLLGPLSVFNGSHVIGRYRGIVAGGRGIHWAIAGGESGAGARPMHPEWARSLRDQCKAAGVPFLFKQWGEWLPHGQTVEDVRLLPKSGGWHGWPDKHRSVRVGKRAAGRLLDGIEHNEFPIP